jgi:acylphosphatase
MTDTGGTRLHLRLYGRVQGVGFRHFARRAAEGLDLAGYVRNCPDGSVEVVAQGPAAALTALRRRLERGPPYGNVRTVTEETPWGGELPHPFEVRW